MEGKHTKNDDKDRSGQLALESATSSKEGLQEESAEVGEVHGLTMNEVPRLYPDWESTRRSSSGAHVIDHIKRDTWKNKIEFVLVLLSVAVGLGNVWRFPFTAYENGGGAFLIPYLIIVTIVSRPLYFFELALGQFCSRGPIGMWDAVPLFRGVGWAIFAVAIITVVYYVSILATCACYIVYGFASTLPWGICYNASYYRSFSPNSFIFVNNSSNFSCVHNKNTGTTYGQFVGPSSTINISTSELFYQYVVKHAVDGIDDGIGAPFWEMSLALFLMWVLIFLNMMLGTKSSGKAAYFTAVFPYVILIILFGRAASLEGATDGMLLFLTPKWEKLLSVEVWYKAMSQSFFSLGIGYGIGVICGSFNPLHGATYNDALIIGIADTLTSILAGLTVFSILGVLAKNTKVSIEEVAHAGPGLAFISYPALMLDFGNNGVPQLFSFLFFTMLVTLGVGSAGAYIQVVSATILDKIPFLTRKLWYKIATVGVLCFLFFLIGLIFCTPGGGWILDIFDNYGAGFIVFVLVFLEVTGIAYFYGMKNFERDMYFMFRDYNCTFNCQLFRYWGYGVPVFFFAILGYVFAQTQDLSRKVFRREFLPPLWAKVFAWGMFTTIVLIPFIFAIATYFTRKTRSPYKKWMACITPSSHWGPKVPEDKLEWVNFKRGHDGSTKLWKCMMKKVFRRKRDDKGVTGVSVDGGSEELKEEASESGIDGGTSDMIAFTSADALPTSATSDAGAPESTQSLS